MRILEEKLFKFKGYDVNEALDIQFYDVVFKMDFGTFKKGITYGCIAINFDECIITEYDIDGQATTKQSFNLVSE